MVWQRRELSEAGIYHVTMRGSGRQVIFEDDTDRTRFLELMGSLLEETRVEVLAWCLMDNHVHLLLRCEMESMGAFMRRLGSSYAVYFNHRHDRVGHLLQGRYGSVPVKTDAQLMATVRYIHRNPEEAGLAQVDEYKWSSFTDYLGKSRWARELTNTMPVLEVFGGAGALRDYHMNSDEEGELAGRSRATTRLTSSAAKSVFLNVLTSQGMSAVPVDSRVERDRVLALLRASGLSVRQIERFTGIGRNVIARAR